MAKKISTQSATKSNVSYSSKKLLTKLFLDLNFSKATLVYGAIALACLLATATYGYFGSHIYNFLEFSLISHTTTDPIPAWKSTIPPLPNHGPELQKGRKYKVFDGDSTASTRANQDISGVLDSVPTPLSEKQPFVNGWLRGSPRPLAVPEPILPGTSALDAIEIFRHDPTAFTQGLAFYEGALYESTGLHGRSQLRVVDVDTGRVIRHSKLPDEHFGEGMVVVAGLAYMLTWQTGVVFVFDAESLEPVSQLPLDRIGWGLAHDPTTDELIVSDGSHQLTWYDRTTMSATRQLDVSLYRAGQGAAAAVSSSLVSELNELEYIAPHVWAHKWHDERIFVIDPATGVVVRIVDGTGLYPPQLLAHRHQEAVFNGVAADYSAGRRGAETGEGGVDGDGREYDLYVTGKLWPVLARVHERIITAPVALPVAASALSGNARDL